jgi:glutathione S-transferase
MTEEHTYWTWVLERWFYDKEKRILRLAQIPSVYIDWIAPRIVSKMAHAQGTGRHSREEVLGLMGEDLRAVSEFLGQKNFLMGDRPCEVDCAVFGQLSQMKWQCPSSVSDLVDKTFPNLGQYCERMKDTFWPDWDDCTTRGGTQTAVN